MFAKSPQQLPRLQHSPSTMSTSQATTHTDPDAQKLMRAAQKALRSKGLARFLATVEGRADYLAEAPSFVADWDSFALSQEEDPAAFGYFEGLRAQIREVATAMVSKTVVRAWSLG